MTTGTPAILEAKGLKKHFAPSSRLFSWKAGAPVRAVEDVSFALGQGETLAIVGESGSGKSTTARMLLWLDPPTEGSIEFDGIDLSTAPKTQLRRFRRSVQAVFQDPWSSLNPRMRVRQIVGEPLALAGHPRGDIPDKIGQALHDVGLETAAIDRFPHEFSGGQRQRIALARAIAVRPRVIVLDEPVSSLDVSVRAQMMNLLKDLQAELSLSYVLISHDLATVRYLASRVAVMYLGRIVEQAETETLFDEPLHPYTAELIAAARLVRPGKARPSSRRPAVALGGSPGGCPFAVRCPKEFARCREEAPRLGRVAPGRDVACHLHGAAVVG